MIKVYTGETLAEGCDIALRNRLYVPGWLLSNQLKLLKQSQQKEHSVLLFYKNGVPIGVAAVCEIKTSNHIMIFVRKSERRKGVGSALLNHYKRSKRPTAIHMSCGVCGSEKFFQCNDVVVV